MPENLHHDSRMDALRKQQRRRRVAEIVNPARRQLRALKQRLEVPDNGRERVRSPRLETVRILHLLWADANALNFACKKHRRIACYNNPSSEVALLLWPHIGEDPSLAVRTAAPAGCRNRPESRLSSVLPNDPST